MVPVAGLWVNVSIGMSVNDAMVNCPFRAYKGSLCSRNLLAAFHREDHPIRVNREFHLDLSWWLEFFQSWNRYSFLLSPRRALIPDIHVSCDAAGSIGCRAILGRDWFPGRWSPLQMPLSIGLQRTLSDCFGSFPVGSSVVCKAGGILF